MSERIVFIDDDAQIAELFATVLSMQGHETKALSEASEISSYIESPSEDLKLVVTDKNMPKMSGGEVVRKFISNDTNGNLKYIVVSGDEELEDEEISSKVYYLKKPFNKDTLFKLVEEIL